MIVIINLYNICIKIFPGSFITIFYYSLALKKKKKNQKNLKNARIYNFPQWRF